MAVCLTGSQHTSLKLSTEVLFRILMSRVAMARRLKNGIPCKKCSKVLPVRAYDQQKLEHWSKTGPLIFGFVCLKCEAIKPRIWCVDCEEQLLEEEFNRDKLAMWRRNKDLIKKAVCTSCQTMGPAFRQMQRIVQWQQTKYTCGKCLMLFPLHKFHGQALEEHVNDSQLCVAVCKSCSWPKAEPQEQKAKSVASNFE